VIRNCGTGRHVVVVASRGVSRCIGFLHGRGYHEPLQFAERARAACQSRRVDEEAPSSKEA
jgi:hypothetical protein